MTINQGLFSSATGDWSTPQDFFDDANREFKFDLDVCASHENAKCARFYTRLDNGLGHSWKGYTCWMNPPYGREIGAWVKKAYEEGCLGTTVVGLLPARTDTKWFHDYIYGKTEIRFVKGRLKFGGSKNSAPFPSMLIVWGK